MLVNYFIIDNTISKTIPLPTTKRKRSRDESNTSPILLDYQKKNMIPPTTTNNNETSPHPDKGSDNMTSNEVIVANLKGGGACPPSRLRATMQLVGL